MFCVVFCLRYYVVVFGCSGCLNIKNIRGVTLGKHYSLNLQLEIIHYSTLPGF